MRLQQLTQLAQRGGVWWSAIARLLKTCNEVPYLSVLAQHSLPIRFVHAFQKQSFFIVEVHRDLTVPRADEVRGEACTRNGIITRRFAKSTGLSEASVVIAAEWRQNFFALQWGVR